MKYDELYTALTSLLAAGSQFDTLRRKENKNVTALVRLCCCHVVCVEEQQVFKLSIFEQSILDSRWRNGEVKNPMANSSVSHLI